MDHLPVSSVSSDIHSLPTVRGKALHLYILSRLRGKRPGMVDVPVILALRGAPGQPGLHGETLSLSDRGRKPV